jgi:hypothetical protein
MISFYFNNVDQLYPIHDWEWENKSIINAYSIKIIYILSKKFFIKIDELEFEYMNEFNNYFLEKFKKKERKNFNSLSFCGLPNINSTSHCFNDQTHRTCCLLGKKAREYSNKSGNPIGKASEEAFYIQNGFKPNEYMLTPWCSCMGSKVCSFYSEKFGKEDGTHIKFLKDKNNNIIFNRDEEQNLIYKHKTPGVK